MLYAQRIPPHPNTRLRWANLLGIRDGQRRFIINTSCLITLYFDFYKVVRAYAVVIHVYEQCGIDLTKNKTFLSSIQIISTTFDKKYQLASSYNFSAITLAPRAKTTSDPCIVLDFVMFVVRKKRSFSMWELKFRLGMDVAQLCRHIDFSYFM